MWSKFILIVYAIAFVVGTTQAQQDKKTASNDQELKNYRINIVGKDTIVIELSEVENFGIIEIDGEWSFDEWGLMQETKGIARKVRPFTLSNDNILVGEIRVKNHDKPLRFAYTSCIQVDINRTNSIPLVIDLSETQISRVNIFDGVRTDVLADDGDIGTLVIDRCPQVSVTCNSCNKVDISRSTIQSAYLYHLDSLVLNDIFFTKDAYLHVIPKKDGSRVQLALGPINFGELDMDYQFFKCDPSYWRVPDNSLTIRNYKLLRDHQAKLGNVEGLELVTKELKEFEYLIDSTLGPFRNWLDKIWWDYGYNKILIIRNSLVLMVIFFIFNFAFYRWLITDTYPIESLSKSYHTVAANHARLHPWRIVAFFVQSLLYTAAVFWGLKLDIGRLSLRYPALTILVILQYTTGIICLAYLANYIIVKDH